MKKATAWILSVAVLMTLAALPGYGQTAQDVLNKMIDAMGGKKALEAIKDTTITGTVELVQANMSAPITIYQKEPNKIRVDVEIAAAGMSFIQAYDGQKGWGTNFQTMATEEMSDDMSKNISHQALGNDSLLNPQKLGITFALKPKEKIEDKDYIVLEQTLADGHKIIMFIDPATYLPYKSVTKSLDPMSGGEVESESFLSDYQKVGGLMVAYSTRVMSNGAEVQRLTITGVTFNTNLDDALFIMK
jgi:outer membrane lipoprotein-sorting protein